MNQRVTGRPGTSSSRLHWEEVPWAEQVIPPRAQEPQRPTEGVALDSSPSSSSSGLSPSPPSSPARSTLSESPARRDGLPRGPKKKRRGGRGRGAPSDQSREWEGQPLGLVWCLQSFETTQEPHTSGQRTVWDEHSVMHVNESSLTVDEPETNASPALPEAEPGPSGLAHTPSKRSKRRGRVKSRKGKAGGRHQAKNGGHPLDGEECASDELSIDSSPETYRRLRRDQAAAEASALANSKAGSPGSPGSPANHPTDEPVRDDDRLTRSP
ncbi:uncharacterized protein LOC131878946 isoform X2 [Tigriopus californicus]|nr:uncharacterized protein LOC131878946 isoform X2 [Tigriopus californicus]